MKQDEMTVEYDANRIVDQEKFEDEFIAMLAGHGWELWASGQNVLPSNDGAIGRTLLFARSKQESS